MATGIKVLCWFARTVCENLLYSISSYLSTSGTSCLQHNWIIHAATQCTHGKFHTVEINVITVGLITCFYKSTEVLEIWALVLCPVFPWTQCYPEIGSVIVVLGDWLSDCCLRKLAQCFTVSDFITFVLEWYACRLFVAQWYETLGIVDTRDTCTVSRYFLLLRYTAVYRDFGDTGIVT